MRQLQEQVEQQAQQLQRGQAQLDELYWALQREVEARHSAEQQLQQRDESAALAARGNGNVADSVAHWTHMNERFQRLVSAVVAAGQRVVPAGSGATLPHVQKLADIPLPGQPLPEGEQGGANHRFSLDAPDKTPHPSEGTAVGWLPLEVGRLLLEQVNEQERLLAGFQAENERLVANEQGARARFQADIGKVAAERDSLAARVHALSGALGVPEDAPLHTIAAEARAARKHHEESKTDAPVAAAENSGLPAPPPNLRRSVEVHGALKRELAVAKTLQEERDLRVADYHKFVAHIEKLQSELQEERNRNSALGEEAKKLAAGAAKEDSKAMQKLQSELERVKAEHKEELTHLSRKLQWYRDNQELLDQDAKRLREQSDTIAQLRRDTDDLRVQLKRAKEAALPGSGASGAAAARRIQELQRALGEAEEALAKRHPDSVSAIVRAATSGPTGSAASAMRTAAGEAAAARAAANAEAEDAARRVKAVRQEYERVVAGHQRRCERLEAALRSVAEKLPPPPGGRPARGGVDVEQLIADAMSAGGSAIADTASHSSTGSTGRGAAGHQSGAAAPNAEAAALRQQLDTAEAQVKQLRGKLAASKRELDTARAFFNKKLKTQAEEAEAALSAAKKGVKGGSRPHSAPRRSSVAASTVQGRLAARSNKPRGGVRAASGAPPRGPTSAAARQSPGRRAAASRGGHRTPGRDISEEDASEQVQELQAQLATQEAHVATLQAQLARATAAAADAVAPTRSVIESLEQRLKRAEEEAAQNAGKATQVERLKGELRVLSQQNKRLAEAAAKPRTATVEQLEALAAEVAHLQRRNAAREAELSSAGAVVRVRAEAEVARVKRQAEEQLQAKHDEVQAMREEVDALVRALQAQAGTAAPFPGQVVVT